MAPASAAANPGPSVPQQFYLAEVKARYDAATGADIGFVERLVWFWSNHFCVSAEKSEVRPLCGAYEREAIRPHVLGTFSGMLLAAEQHPAMLRYLDNTRSIGPDSRDGLRQKRGLNENLAREILELHTLGVRSGYSQDDVTRLAEALTGWTTIRLPMPRRRAANSASIRTPISPARGPSSARPTALPVWSRAGRCSPISPAIRRRRSMSQPSSRFISSPTIRRRLWSRSSRGVLPKPRAISRNWRWR
jgi:hypothetical protein